MYYYTASQIVADACSIAKCPGYTAQGGRSLNLVLDDLCLHRNLKVSLKSGTIVVPAGSNGPFSLEADYLRTYDLFYLVADETYFLSPASLREYDSESSKASITNYPSEWASDLSDVGSGGVGKLYIYPQSSGQISMTHRYYVERPVIVTPETSPTIPWFPDVDYLVTATAARLMRITDDSRYDKFIVDSENLLKKHLMTEGDEQQVVKEVELDPRRFKVGGSNRPTKLNPY